MKVQSIKKLTLVGRFSHFILIGFSISTSFLLSQSASAGVIALGSELYLQARARSNGSAIVVDIDSDSQTSSLNGLSVDVSAVSTSSGGR